MRLLICFVPVALFGLTVDVNSTDDALTFPAPAGSLRAAIDDINAAPDASNTITFSTTGTITLAGPLPPITLGDNANALDIVGPGSGDMTIAGSDPT